MDLVELVEKCKQSDCEYCAKETRETCKEFKRIMEGIKEPWEMTRLLQLAKKN